ESMFTGRDTPFTVTVMVLTLSRLLPVISNSVLCWRIPAMSIPLTILISLTSGLAMADLPIGRTVNLEHPGHTYSEGVGEGLSSPRTGAAGRSQWRQPLEYEHVKTHSFLSPSPPRPRAQPGVGAARGEESAEEGCLRSSRG